MKNLRVLAVLLLFFVAISGLLAQNLSKIQQTESNYYVIRDQLNAYWKTQPREPGTGHGVFRRWEWYWENRLMPDGTFPPSNLNTLEWNKYQSQHTQADGGSAANWTSLGPSSSTSGYNGIGRVNCVAVHPTNTSQIWLGTPAGGLWKSTNGGSSWTTTTDNFTVLGVTAIVFDPINPNTMYIGTGDGFSSDTRSIGVLKSTDGGVTWNTTGLSWSVTTSNYIRFMAIHPTTPNIVLVAASTGLYRSADSGATWTKIVNDDFYDVKFKPGDPNTLYAASDNRVYKSTNTGTSFATIYSPASSDRLAIGVTPANPELLAVVSSSSGSTDFGALKGFYVSTNSGTAFTTKSTTPNILGSAADGSSVKGQGWYDLCFTISPTNANLMFVGGVNMWRSLDGGATWSLLTHWRGSDAPSGVPVVHADKHALAWSGTTLFQGCDGGLYKTSNNGTSWTDISSNLAISQMYRLGVSQADNKVLCGLQDNGTKLRSTSGNWTDNIGGDGMECFIHPTNSNIMYGELQYGAIRRSTNGGASWSSSIYNNLPDEFTGAWVTPFIMDPNTPTTIYVGYNEVYKSTDQGNNWTAISTSLSPSASLRFLAVAPGNSQYIYASDGYAIFKTTDGGANWSTVNGNLPGSLITYLTVSPDSPNEVYVTFSGYTANRKVYRTVTGGGTWVNISGTLPNLPANCVLVQPNSSGVLYVGMDIGVYRLDAGATDWTLFSTGIPNVPVMELEIRHSTGKIRAATYGRGLWESDLEPLTNPCLSPQSLSATAVDARTATLNWAPVANASSYTLELRKTGAPTWSSFAGITPVTQPFYYFSPCENYEFRVQAVCPGKTSPASAIQAFSTTGCSGYCTSFGESASPSPAPQAQAWIASLGLNTLSHSSGNNWGYSDATAQSTQLTQTEGYGITLTPGFAGPGQAVNWAVWIDYNQDKDFDDPGEAVYTGADALGPANGIFAVPADALLGPTRLRVSMKSAGLPAACETAFAAGETEDYTVDIQKAPPALTINPGSLFFSASGEVKTLSLETNCDWTLSGLPAWLSATPQSGGPGVTLLSLTASANSSIDSLLANLLVSGCDGAVQQILDVRQAAAAPALAVVPGSLTFSANGETQTLVLSTNCNWTASGLPAWLTLAPLSGNAGQTTLSLTAGANSSLNPLSATLSFEGCAGLALQTLGVTQNGAAPALSVVPGSLSFPAEGDTRTLTIQTNCDWSIDNIPAWLTVDPLSGAAGQTTLSLTAGTHAGIDAQAVLLLVSGCNGQIQQELPVTQVGTGPALSLDPNSLSFPAPGATKTVSLYTNCDWEIAGVPAWLTVEPLSGSAGMLSLTLTAAENSSLGGLSALLGVSGCGGQVMQALAVEQNGAAPVLSLDPGSLNFVAAGETQTISLYSNCAWSLDNAPSWLTVEPASGSAGTATISLTAAENTSLDALLAQLLFSGCGGVVGQSLAVSQGGAAPALTLDPGSLDFVAPGETKTVTLYSNCAWTLSGAPAWLTVDPQSGTAGTATLTLTAKENLSIDGLAAQVLVSGCNGAVERQLALSQSGAAPVLSILPDSLFFPAKGEAQNIVLHSNCDWALSSAPAWLTVTPAWGSAGTVLLEVTAAANTSLQELLAALVFSGCNGQVLQSLGVVQDAAPLQFQPLPLTFVVEHPAACVELVLLSNTAWTATADVPWIASVTPASGTGSDTLEICFTDNDAIDARSGHVVLVPQAGGDTLRVLLLQNPKPVGVLEGESAAGNRVWCVPNPAREATVLYLQTRLPQQADIDVYAADGRLVQRLGQYALQAGENRIDWQPGDLPPGQYTFRCRFEAELLLGQVLWLR